MGVRRSVFASLVVAVALAMEASAQDADDRGGRIPLVFVENHGQHDAALRFVAHAGRVSIFCEADGFTIQLRDETIRAAVPSDPLVAAGLEPLGGAVSGINLAFGFGGNTRRVVPTGEDEIDGRFNYFLGSDANSWVTDVPAFQSVRYASVGSGIDAILTMEQGRLALSLDVEPGADPGNLTLTCNGADVLALNAGREMVLALPSTRGSDAQVDLSAMMVNIRDVTTAQPVARHDEILPAAKGQGEAKAGSGGGVLLDYGTYMGGGEIDEARGVAILADGPFPTAFVCGRTLSATMIPRLPGAFDASFNGADDAFIAKFTPGDYQFEYASYIGGSGIDAALDVAVNSSGEAYVVGSSFSSNFPTTAGAFDVALEGGSDAFMLKLNAAGSALVYSTYVGGSGFEAAYALAVDGSGAVYTTGQTSSSNFPLSVGAFNTVFNTGSGFALSDVFVTKLAPDAASLTYSTYIAGNQGDAGFDIAIDGNGAAHVAVQTDSSNLPVSPGALDPTYGGVASDDGYIGSINATGSALLHGTYLATTGDDSANGIAVDASGEHLWVTGTTGAGTFPTTAGAYDTTFNGENDAFVLKIAIPQSTLDYSTFLGGAKIDIAWRLAVDETGSAYVAGGTHSTDFPITPSAFDASPVRLEGFVSRLDPQGSRLVGSSYIGGSSSDQCLDIAVDSDTSVAFVVGSTRSANFPVTLEALDQTHNGAADAFMATVRFP